ncbi:hypothetical protein B296_00005931 [Ensete ventricosum]|uniref:Uncharacterized protein n=1 Tax=Ensete ventricosum TaxID=4639 RepID=A0A427B5N0_ENSVE|nr:hypothetical protein B296_00005931 [Ensete ventricosum]
MLGPKLELSTSSYPYLRPLSSLLLILFLATRRAPSFLQLGDIDLAPITLLCRPPWQFKTKLSPFFFCCWYSANDTAPPLGLSMGSPPPGRSRNQASSFGHCGDLRPRSHAA